MDALSRPAIGGTIVPSTVQRFRALVADRIHSAPVMRLVDFVGLYATNHDIEPETARQYLVTAERLEAWAGETFASAARAGSATFFPLFFRRTSS
ncbi:MAG: hypothetical protein WCR51_04400 [Planctomycetia bacterium]